MISSLRKEDERREKIVSRFLDENFYQKVENFERITKKYDQVKGVDVRFKLNNKEYVCDEKAAVRYINKPLRTFAMELHFTDRSSEPHIGWLFDETKVNNSFLFIWLDEVKSDLLEDISEIKTLEIALVDKVKIYDYLEKIGWDKKNIFTKVDNILTKNDKKMGDLKENGCKFSYSQALIEKPINILIPRHILREISDFTKRYETSN